MGILRQLGEYLFIVKRNPDAPRSSFTKYMHGMNRISLLMFLAALLFMLIKFVIVPWFR